MTEPTTGPEYWAYLHERCACGHLVVEHIWKNALASYRSGCQHTSWFGRDCRCTMPRESLITHLRSRKEPDAPSRIRTQDAG